MNVTRLEPIAEGDVYDDDEDDLDDEADDDPDVPEESRQDVPSPPTTPSTIAGKLSEIGLKSSARVTRASLRRDPDTERRKKEDDEELSDGDGSVYSELSIG